MAYATKYRISFKDVSNVLWNIDFQYDGYSGSITSFTPGPQPAVLRYNTDDKYKPIVSSSLDIQVVHQSELDDLFTEADQAIRVCLFTEYNNYWYGFLIPNQYYRRLNTKPYYATFTATDQFRILEQIKYEDGSGDPYYYLTTDLTAISNILAKTGLLLSTKEGINIYEDNFNSADADSPIDQVYFYSERYWEPVKDERSDCYTVIKDIIKKYGARLFQSELQWYLQRPNAMWSKHTVRTFTAATPMVYLSNTNDYVQWNRASNSGIWMAFPEIEKKPRAGRVEITADPGRKPNVCLNGEFDDFTHEGTDDPYYWQYDVGVSFSASDGYISLGESDSITDPSQAAYIDFYLEHVTSINFVIEFQATYSGGTNCVLHFAFSFVNEGLWWQPQGYPGDHPIWTGSEQHYEFDVHSEIGSSMTDYATLTIPYDARVPDGASGAFRFHVFEVFNNDDTTCALNIRRISIEPSYSNSYLPTRIYTKDNDTASYNIVKEKIAHCDSFADISNPTASHPDTDDMFWVLRKGAAYDDCTSSWYIKGDPETETTGVKIQDLLAKQYIEGYDRPTDILKGRLRYNSGLAPYQYHEAIVEDDITDSYGYSKVFVPLNQAWNIHRMIWSGSWIETSPVYNDESLSWDSYTYTTGTIDGNEFGGSSNPVSGTDSVTSESYDAIAGETVRIVINLTDFSGDLPDYDFDGNTGTLAEGYNYLEFYITAAGSKTLVVSNDDGETVSLTVTFVLYSLKGI